MSTPDKPLPRVQIVNREHPHFEEYGRFTGKVITMRFSGEDMAEVTLENCRHGGDGCFVSRGDVCQVPERTGGRGGRKEREDEESRRSDE